MTHVVTFVDIWAFDTLINSTQEILGIDNIL